MRVLSSPVNLGKLATMGGIVGALNLSDDVQLVMQIAPARSSGIIVPVMADESEPGAWGEIQYLAGIYHVLGDPNELYTLSINYRLNAAVGFLHYDPGAADKGVAQYTYELLEYMQTGSGIADNLTNLLTLLTDVYDAANHCLNVKIITP